MLSFVTPVKNKDKEEKTPTPLSPLSISSKNDLFKKLATFSDGAIQNALIHAALENQSFPSPLNEDVQDMQRSYQRHKTSSPVNLHLKSAITTYLQTDGIKQFKELLQSPFVESEWRTDFLRCVASQLKMEMKEEPLVQAAIQDGKIYWRIIAGEQVVYDRCRERGYVFDFGHAKTWLMNWEQFRKFKDGGKRTGTVSVTLARFVDEFREDWKKHARWVWQNLCKTGVLDSTTFRLSHSWYPVTGVSLIFNKLLFDHQVIADVLFKITNNKNYQETISVIPGAYIYRPARVYKRWSNTGRIQNSKNETCFVQMWDIGVYGELSSATRKQDNPRVVLENDHIPATAALKAKGQALIEECNAKIENIISERTAIEELISEKRADLARDQILTRAGSANTANDEIIVLQKNCDQLQESQVKQEKIKEQIMREIKDPKLSWTAAIPKALHVQGDTYKKRAKQQAKLDEHPFLANVRSHINNLPNVAPKENFLTVLGAFRYMYRRMCKEPVSIIEDYLPIGRLPCAFFTAPQVKKKIDHFFTEQIQAHMARSEGPSQRK